MENMKISQKMNHGVDGKSPFRNVACPNGVDIDVKSIEKTYISPAVCNLIPKTKIKIGTTAQLKSGGPIMTVCSIDNTIIMCDWFLDGKRYRKEFHIDTLKFFEENNES